MNRTNSMLQRSDHVAYMLQPIVTWVLRKIKHITGCSTHTIGAYQMGLYVYPETIHVTAIGTNPGTLRLISKALEDHPLVTDCVYVQRNGNRLCVEFTVVGTHFRVYCGHLHTLRMVSYTRSVFLKWPVCRFAATCLRHLVILFSIASGLPHHIIDATTVATLALIHHTAYMSTSSSQHLTVLDTPVYIRSFVGFLHQLRPNRVYTTTLHGQLIVDAPPFRTEALALDNPCVLHPMCHTRNLLQSALYFRHFQSWISVIHFVWVCS
jgi:hypothetical protein